MDGKVSVELDSEFADDGSADSWLRIFPTRSSTS